MPNIDIKKIIFYLPLVILIFITINYLFNNNDLKEKTFISNDKIKTKEIIKEIYIPSKQAKEKIITKTITKYIKVPIPKKEENNNTQTNNTIVKNIYIDDIQDYDIKTKNETITLTSRYDINKKYKVSVISNSKIVSQLPSASYIVLNANIYDEDITSKVSFSFNEYYAKYAHDLFIQIQNQEDNTSVKCDGSFLSGVSSEYTYNVSFDISGDLLSCYIISQSEMPDIKELFNNSDIKSLDINLSEMKNDFRDINSTKSVNLY
jgi:hypothetical protein